MNITKCLICGKHLEKSNRKYCSKECYHKSRRGKKRPEFAKKIKEIMLNKKESYKNTLRAKNISKARLHKITENEWNIIDKNKNKYSYVTNVKIFLEHINLTHICINRYAEIQKYRKPFSKLTGNSFLPIYIQKFSYLKYQELVKDISKLPYDVVLNRYKIGLKSFFKIMKIEGIENYVYKKIKINRVTKIEQIIKDILDKLSIKYKFQSYIKHRLYRSDFMIDDIIIEVNGDYWHGNPRVYKEDDLNSTQKKKISIDSRKIKYCIDNNFIVVIIWEMDIYNHLDKVENFLKRLKTRSSIHEKYYDSRFF